MLVEHIAQKFSREMGVKGSAHYPLKSCRSFRITIGLGMCVNYPISSRGFYIRSTATPSTLVICRFPYNPMGGDSPKFQSTLLKRLREDMEKEALIHTIRLAKDNKNKAAKLLGIHRTSLYKKMKKLNIPTKQIKNV